MKQLVPAMIGILLPTVLLAQNRPEFYRAELAGGYSFLSVDTNGATSRQNFNGWEGSGALNLTSWLGVQGDLGGYYKDLGSMAGVDVHAHDYLFTGGPKLTLRPLFFHALFGVDRFTGTTSATGALLPATVSVTQNAFASVLGGGIDLRMSPHWAIRPSIDYVLTRHGVPTADTQNDLRLGVGLVYGFGR